MEKHDWNERLGRQIMETYERVLPITELERQVLYYLFRYPEKYWKQINFYYNANKAWVPAKSTEKIKNWRHSRRCARSLSAFSLVGNFRNRKFRMIPVGVADFADSNAEHRQNPVTVCGHGVSVYCNMFIRVPEKIMSVQACRTGLLYDKI